MGRGARPARLQILEEVARTEPALGAMSHVMIARLHDERGDVARAAHAMETARDAYEIAVEAEQARSSEGRDLPHRLGEPLAAGVQDQRSPMCV